MGKKLMSVQVRGKVHEWAFHFYGNPKDLDMFRADGLDVIVIENQWPAWLPPGLVRPWCFVQDLLNFKNPFKDLN